MKMIKRHIKIPIYNNRMIVLINSLNGAVVSLSERDKEVFDCLVAGGDVIQPKEEAVYHELVRHGFIVPNDYDEESVFWGIVSSLKTSETIDFNQVKQLFFILTYNCNFRCPYCFEAQQHFNGVKGQQIINRDQIDTAISLCPNVKEIVLFGGEPLLSDNYEIVKYLFQTYPHIQYSVITNGYMLVEYLGLLQEARIGSVQVTLDGPESSHNRTRVLKEGSHSNGTYSKILEGISACLSNNIHVRVRMTVTANPQHLRECLSHRNELMTRFSKYADYLTFELAPIFQVAQDRKLNIYSELYAFDLNTNEGQYNRSLDTEIPIVKALLLGSKIRPQIKYCVAQYSHRVFFDPRGEMYTCILSVGDSNLSIGKYYPNLCLKSESYIMRDISKIPECIECEYSLFCGGGCAQEGCAQGRPINFANCTRTRGLFCETIPKILEGKISFSRF